MCGVWTSWSSMAVDLDELLAGWLAGRLVEP